MIYNSGGVQDHVVLVRPHGNAKKTKDLTKESTKNMLKAELEPKIAVFEDKGVITLAKTAGDLPRD